MARRKPIARRTGRRVQSGRQGLWLRQASYSPTLVEQVTGTFSDIVATPDDWERDYQVGTQTMRGAGASRLERMFGQFSFQTTYDTDGATPISPVFEVLIWEQSAQFASLVTDGTQFDNILENQRVLWHKTYESLVRKNVTGAVFSGYCSFEVKSKVRLADKSLGFAIRLGFDTAFSTRGTDVLANWVGYVTTP